MPQVIRRNRKGSNEEIIRLNSIGLSLNSIAAILNCHPTSITLRLKSLNIPPADTRRAFMEDILGSLPPGSQDVIADHLASDSKLNIKDYVRELILKDLEDRMVPARSTQEI